MSSPSVSDPDDALWCSEPGCGRPAVYESTVCRIHLVDVLRSEGRGIRFDDQEIAGMWAAAVHFLWLALSVVPNELLAPEAPTARVDVAALVDGRVHRRLAHMVTDLLATQVANTFGWVSLDPPKDHKGNTLLMFRALVPAAEVVAPRLEAATAGVLIEMFGADALIGVVARPASDRRPDA